MVQRIAQLSVLLLLSGCQRFAPQVYNDHICYLVDANLGWGSTLKQAAETYQVSPGLVMSVIFHESSFHAQARPERKQLFGVIPWQQSSAYGYGQIKDETWAWYKSHHSGWFQSRTHFSDTVDFIGWYYQVFQRKAKLDNADFNVVARDFYLAYHEGLGGYARKTYVENTWLLKKAKAVSERAVSYDQQLMHCL